MILLDTNVILRYIARDIPDQTNAADVVVQRIVRGEEEAVIIFNVIH